jgi:hypothetical protein
MRKLKNSRHAMKMKSCKTKEKEFIAHIMAQTAHKRVRIYLLLFLIKLQCGVFY